MAAKLINVASNKALLALVEHCGGSVWCVTLLDKSVKAKDVRLIDAEPLELTISTQTRETYNENGLITSCSITPKWKPTSSNFKMMPPDSINIESMIAATDIPDFDTHLASQLDSQLAVLGDLRSSPRKVDLPSMLSTKYYEALYVAQTPVSYFAKSTLSRARAMCKEKHQPLDDTPEQRTLYLDTLIPILKSLILDILDLDSKYDTHNFHQAVKCAQDFSAYSREEQKYMKSWAADLDESKEFKSGVELLKTREIQLQIILLMEILASEVSRDANACKNATPLVAKRPVVLNPRQTGLVRLKKKPKKSETEESPHEPSTQMLAIAMFDRLCIRNLSEGEANQRFLDNAHFDTPAQAAAAADKTQEFCREAIMPFFNSRLPDLCKTFVQSCRGNSTGLSRIKQVSKQSVIEPKPAEDKPPIAAGSLTSFKESQTTKAGKTTSFRGGLLNPKKPADDRRQIEMTFRSSMHEKEDELRNAIREVSKPSRVSVSQQHANSLPSTQIKSLPKRKSALVKPYTARLPAPSFQETRQIEVESTPMRRKRQLKAGLKRSTQKNLHTNSQNIVMIDGEIYSGEEDGQEPDEEVIFETPMKKKQKYNGGTNFNDRLAALSSSRVPKLTAADDEEIMSSPVMKTPRHDLSSEHRGATDLKINPIYDENSPQCLFPDRSPLRTKQKRTTTPSLKRKSRQWFDDEFPMTKSQSDLF